MWNTYVALDLETTGLSPMRDQILEIGAVRVENGEITGTYETLVDSGVEIPARITDLTGITAEMTAGSPQLREAVEGFLEFSGDAVLLGHNLPFDYGFMKRNVVKLGGVYERHGLDTLAIAKSVLAGLPGRALNQVAAHYGILQEHHHRALDDAITASRIYACMAAEFGALRPELFEPTPLTYKLKKETPITISQKGYLRDLAKYHKIEINVKIEELTKSEASRMIDGIISQYGRIMR